MLSLLSRHFADIDPPPSPPAPPPALTACQRGLGTSGGLYYFPINFDGATQFMPVSSEEDGGAALDDAIEVAYT